MFWYLFICFLLSSIYAIWNITQKQLSWKKMALFLMFTVLWVFASLRSDSVGADTRQYIVLIEQLKDYSFQDLLNKTIFNATYSYYTNWEIGFRFLMWLYAKVFFFLPARVGLSYIAFVILFFLYNAIKYQSYYCFLSIWLYVTLGFFQTGLNMAQNALAIGIVLWGLKYLIDNKLLKWIIVVAIATSIHYSSIAFLPLFWIAKVKFNFKKTFMVILMMGMLYSFGSIVLRIASRFVPNRYFGYLNTGSYAWGELAVLLLHLILIIVVWVHFISISNRREELTSKIDESEKFFLFPYYSFFLCEVVCYILSVFSSGMLRAATLFSPAIILYIPNMIRSIDSLNKRRRCLIAIYVLALVGYVARMLVNNIGTTQPYTFFL